ncbi:MAG: hypothetical protein LBI42_09470 [Chitinispirillales bacterium]|jgi:hypothetical protein|nr:hypothetical protein [Chitinispirillales bacterium]
MSHCKEALAFAVVLTMLSLTYAQDKSVGIGGFFSNNFGGGGVSQKFLWSGSSISGPSDIKLPDLGGGIHVFYSTLPIEVSVGAKLANGKMKFDNFRHLSDDLDFEVKISYCIATFAVMVKYPITLSKKLTSFPAVGVEYEFCYSVKIASYIYHYSEPYDFSRCWLKFGIGADYDLSKKIYLRSVLLYGVGEKNGYERKLRGDVFLSHGRSIKAGLGYRL